MENRLRNAVWELTVMCNMRCEHCGSSCENAAEDELTTEEALDLCDQLGELGLMQITLSGGELTTRKDWHLIAERCVKNGIITSMITNGWLLTPELLKKAKDAGMNTVAISIDGCKETHDKIRREGSFDRDIKALTMIKEAGLIPAVITTIQKQNLEQLPKLYELFSGLGVATWQLQMALPMGNFTKCREQLIDPKDVFTIIDFANSKLDGPMMVDLGDCFGYYTKKDADIRRKRYGNKAQWMGCSAGKCGIGILCNGDIVGCTSIRSKEYIEGNIREKRLSEIWNNPNGFAWSRGLKKEDLDGNCKSCSYGDYCLGGCPNLRLCVYGDINAGNGYCAYSQKTSEAIEKVNEIDDENELYALACKMAACRQNNLAVAALTRLYSLGYENDSYKELEAYLCFFENNYLKCKKINSELIEKNDRNYRAYKGYGLALYKLGDTEGALKALYKSLGGKDTECYNDLASVLKAENRLDELKNLEKEWADIWSRRAHTK